MVIEWTPSLSVGVAEIDAQHQEMFRRAERLIVALRTGDRSEVQPLLEFLADYVIEHFEAEEREMRAAGFPEYAAHKAAHDAFRRDFEELAGEVQRSGASPLAALTLHNWISDWLRRHIAGVDQELGRFLLARG